MPGFGVEFDWITPLLCLGGDIAHRGGCTVFIYTGNGPQAECVLHDNGIPTWGGTIADGGVAFHVPARDYERAVGILRGRHFGVE
jgi:hypothetical protein